MADLRAGNSIPKTVVITGGPAVGKTTVIEALSGRYTVFHEAARLVLTRNAQFIGKTAVEARGLTFQQAIWRLQSEHFLQAQKMDPSPIFFDRGIPDSIAYLTLSHITPPPELIRLAEKSRYGAVFILEPLPFYAPDTLRTESRQEAEKLTQLILEAYIQLEYQPIRIPFASVEERIRQILRRCQVV